MRKEFDEAAAASPRSRTDRNGESGVRRSRRNVLIGFAVAGGAAVVGAESWVGSIRGAGYLKKDATPAAACPAASPVASPAASPQVTIENFAFMPAALTVPAGTEVIWMNLDDIPHTVTSADRKTFGSPLLDTGDQFSWRFATPGTYAYFCALHPFMTGKIIVQ